jgi:hypothetical protein
MHHDVSGPDGRLLRASAEREQLVLRRVRRPRQPVLWRDVRCGSDLHCGYLSLARARQGLASSMSHLERLARSGLASRRRWVLP